MVELNNLTRTTRAVGGKKCQNLRQNLTLNNECFLTVFTLGLLGPEGIVVTRAVCPSVCLSASVSVRMAVSAR